jgi:cytochrome c biogenesis protein CcmG/thiol:disulfide interchange protein DsbE
MRISFIAPLAIFLVMIFIMLARLVTVDTNESSKLIGRSLPVFSLDNTKFSHNDLSGKYSLLNIFGSWCIACKIEHPLLMKLQQKNILPIYGIAWNDKPDNLLRYLNKYGNPYKKTGIDMTGQAIINLGVTGAPETFLISPDGLILYHHTGALTEDVFNNKILPLIK